MGNFHKDCIHYAECREKEVKMNGHKMIRFWCPEISKRRHKLTTVLKCVKYNLGEAYDKCGGDLYYKGDLHSIKVDCRHFVPIQNNLFYTKEVLP